MGVLVGRRIKIVLVVVLQLTLSLYLHRMFLSSFALMGESQEIDRIMSHFSQHYHNENPGTFPSKDTIHAIVSAMLLLNSDLHKEVGGPHLIWTTPSCTLPTTPLPAPPTSMQILK